MLKKEDAFTKGRLKNEMKTTKLAIHVDADPGTDVHSVVKWKQIRPKNIKNPVASKT